VSCDAQTARIAKEGIAILSLANRVLSRLGAFGDPAFAAIWTASMILNIGTAMFDTGSAWLMTNLNADPMAVSRKSRAFILAARE
jgi:hypothetical protein